MKIKSKSFRTNGAIPARFTCEGADVSPPLSFDASDSNATSLALIVDDPDSPEGRFAHWIVYNLPASTKDLPEGVTQAELPPQAQLGMNGFSRIGWAGPCPRVGGRKHHYAFTLYALDGMLRELDAPTMDELVEAMTGRILGQARLVGTYQLAEHGTEAETR